MLLVLLLILQLLGLNYVSCIQSKEFFDKIILPLDHSRALLTDCTSFNRFTDLSSIPFTVVMYSPNAGTLYGYGMALSPHWILTTAKSATLAKANIDLTYVYRDIDDVNTGIVNASPSKRKIREVITHTSWTGSGVGGNIAVVRTCPKFETSSYFTLPTSLALDCMKKVFVFTYGNSPLSYFCSYVSTSQMCTYFHGSGGFNSNDFFCLEDTSQNGGYSVYGDEINNAPFVMLDNVIVGFVVGIDTRTQKRTATVIKIEQFNSWIQEKAVE